LVNYALNVQVGGNDTGTVTSDPAGIDCGSSCSVEFTEDTVITLTATPAAGATFTGWSGACSGTSTCQLTMNTAHSVTANFAIAGTQTLVYLPLAVR
jgi:hypothetical protein